MGYCRHPDRQVCEFDILKIKRFQIDLKQVQIAVILKVTYIFLPLRLTVLMQHKLNLVCSQFINEILHLI